MTSNDSTRLLTVGDIAELAGVSPSAVSNWRTRHNDFPLPTASTAGGDLFGQQDVLSWLARHEKQHSEPAVSAERILWSMTESLRGALTHEDAALLTLQLVFAQTQVDSADAENSKAARRFWKLTDAHERLIGGWGELVEHLSRKSPELTRVLALPLGTTEGLLKKSMDLFRTIDTRPVDLPVATTSFLRRIEEFQGARGGYSATPDGVGRMMLALAQPLEGVVYDPASGIGMLLRNAWEQSEGSVDSVFGQEVSEYSWRLGYLHLAIAGVPFVLATGDTLRDDRFRSRLANRVLLDPPIADKVDAKSISHDDRWRFGVPRGNAEWLWAQHVIAHLGPGGIGVMTTATGPLFRRGPEAAVRRAIVEAGLIDAVVELPPGLHASTAMPIALIVFTRKHSSRQGVLFVNASQLGTTRRGRTREISEKDIARVATAIRDWRAGKFRAQSGFSTVATIEEIATLDFSLLPARYVEFEASPVSSIDGEAIEQRLSRIRAQLEAQAGNISKATAHLVAAAAGFLPRDAESWPSLRLGDLLLSLPRTGVRQEQEKPGAETPFVTTRMVSAGPGLLERVPTEITQGQVRDRLVEKGDLLLVSRGIDLNTAIKCATVGFSEPATYSESLIRLRVDTARMAPDFLRLYLTSRQGREALSAATTGSVIANLRSDALVEIKVPLPPLDEQQRIVASALRIEASIGELTHALGDSTALLDTVREGIAAGILSTPV